MPAAGRARRRHADRRERVRATPRRPAPARAPVRTPMPTASARSPSRRTRRARSPAHATSTLTVERRDDRGLRRTASAPQLGRRGCDVRRREHPDHAGDGHQPGRHEPHADRPRERQRGPAPASSNAPNGTAITFSLRRGPRAAFVGPSSCTTAGGTGSCTVVISRTTTGTTTIKASDRRRRSAALTLHRESGTAKAGDSADATKLWADDTARTDILNASGSVVTTVVSRHGRPRQGVRRAGRPERRRAVPNPTGNVVFHRYATIDCTGTPVEPDGRADAGLAVDGESDDFAPTANMSYRAEYLRRRQLPGAVGRL